MKALGRDGACVPAKGARTRWNADRAITQRASGGQNGCLPEPPPFCGDSICQADETAAACQQHCFVPLVCGDVLSDN